MSRTGWVVLAILGALMLGGIVGYNLREPVQLETVRYVKGDTVRHTIISPGVKTVEYKDSIVYISVVEPALEGLDTTKLTELTLRDWGAKRLYEGQAFKSDTIGEATYTATIQYNRLQDISFVHVPVTREIIRPPRPKRWGLAAGAGWNSFNIAELQAGVRYNNTILTARWLRDYSGDWSSGVGVGVLVFW